MLKIKETDLYQPIKTHLEAMGYCVKGEIKNCDIVAIKDNQHIIIELKVSLNITLLLQSIDRFILSDTVYIAIPKQCSIYKKQSKQVKKLLAKLGVGLIVVDFVTAKNQQNHYVEIVSDPKDYAPRKNRKKETALLKEFHQRIGDTQIGGSTRQKAGLTAYRQRSIRIANYLAKHAHAKGMEINKAITEPQATAMLYQDHYGWFDKVDRGVYQLSEKGIEELKNWQKK